MVQIFISYRRDDTAGYARAVYDELARRYGAERVFIDVDDIAAGQSFAAVIRGAVSSSSVVLVLIGKRWRGERDGAARRLDDPDDFVRTEVAAALASGAPVIPVPLDGVQMPSEQQLPPSLRSLASRNAFELRATAFGADMARLMAELEPALQPAVHGAARPGARVAAAPTAAPSRTRRGVLRVALPRWSPGWPQRGVGGVRQATSRRRPAPPQPQSRSQSPAHCGRTSTAPGRPTCRTTGPTRNSKNDSSSQAVQPK